MRQAPAPSCGAVLWLFVWLQMLCGSPVAVAADTAPSFTRDEIAGILRHGPWPPPRVRDSSNHVSGNAQAVAFGERLFFDARLSINGKLACATCHVPASGWADRRAMAAGLGQTLRNTLSVINAGFNRWFGWSGASDSLWAASLRPLLDRGEMGSAERHVAALIRRTPELACDYRSTFGRDPEADDESVFVNVGKALAAYQETLVSARTPFDDFRDALARNDRATAARYPLAAQRGARLFTGKGGCNTCHVGPHFTNGEFDKVGIPVRHADGNHDWGRYDGVKTVLASRFNLQSRYNDNPARAQAISTRHVALTVETYGAFKVPGLRNISLTAPYMHDGSLANLLDVVRHYSEIDEVKLHIAASHPHAELGEELPSRPAQVVPRTLNLTEQEMNDLVAFLETLTEPRPMIPNPAARSAACR
jgi:cytochrome c peroxidase